VIDRELDLVAVFGEACKCGHDTCIAEDGVQFVGGVGNMAPAATTEARSEKSQGMKVMSAFVLTVFAAWMVSSAEVALRPVK
jgi:hypothetical protein